MSLYLCQLLTFYCRSSSTFPDGKLRKRIWWLLYIRDRQCAVALGLPTRIRDEDCDLEMLELSDLEEESGSSYPAYLGTQKREHVLYCIHMAKLAGYCRCCRDPRLIEANYCSGENSFEGICSSKST